MVKATIKKTSALFCVFTLSLCCSEEMQVKVHSQEISQNNTPPLMEGPNPSRGKQGLKEIHQYIQTYRESHNGLYPQGNSPMATLHKDMILNYKSYGFDNPDSAFASLRNPDVLYSSNPYNKARVKSFIPYTLRSVRWDGSFVGSTKLSGTRDALAWTDIYNHIVTTTNSRGTQNLHHSGVWIVLWEDGDVEEVPYDEMLYLIFDGSVTQAFSGESGIGLNAFSYSEYWYQIFKLSQPILNKLPVGNSQNFAEDNGGPESLVQFSRRSRLSQNHGVTREELWTFFDPTKLEFSLAEIRAGATKLGLNTQVEKRTLAQLQKRGTPALLFLQDDGRIVTLTSLDDDRAVVIDRGLTRNIERSILEKRYSGEALVPTKALTQNAAIVADDAVREFKLPSLDAEVPQQFVLRNTGTTPITLQLEYPLLGVTESKLSKDTIAPGETATLDLKVKWRSILKTPYQNVLVSIQTNDPIVPRLQLAILLTPPQGTAK